MKSVFVPHLGRTIKFGRKRPVARCPRLHLGNYLRGPLPAPPASCDFTKPAAPVLSRLFGNDRLGDCVIAAGYHIVGVETGNAGRLFAATEAQIEKDYGAIGGYVPGDDSTDQGCDEQTALNYWLQHGFCDGTKPLGWIAVDATNKQQVQLAQWLFENLFFGIELPDSWVNPFPSASGFVWDADNTDPENGHAVAGVGFDAQGVQISTWGMIGTITWAAISALCGNGGGGELYAILTPDQLVKGQQKAPNGVDWSMIIRDFNALGGHAPVPVPPPPAPVPTPPAPAPTVVTLQQAQAWSALGLALHWPKP